MLNFNKCFLGHGENISQFCFLNLLRDHLAFSRTSRNFRFKRRNLPDTRFKGKSFHVSDFKKGEIIQTRFSL